MIAAGFEKGFHASGHIERQHLFTQSPDSLRPVVIAPVTRIQNHCVEIGKARPLLKESTSRQ
jgi:mRNA degradation ribonuclease J1/J2